MHVQAFLVHFLRISRLVPDDNYCHRSKPISLQSEALQCVGLCPSFVPSSLINQQQQQQQEEVSTQDAVQLLQKSGLYSIRGGGSLATVLATIRNDISNSKAKCWILLWCSIILESVSTSINKKAADENSIQLFLVSCVLFLITVSGFNVSLAQIEVGTAYACWSALGCLLVNLSGIVFFGESYDFGKLLCLVLIIAGVVGLNVREGTAVLT